MAIPSSPDWSVASSINYSKTTTTHQSVFPLDSKCKSLHFLCLPFRNLRVFIPNSTGCPSPILEDPSSSTTQPPPILPLNPKIQHFTAEDEDAHFLSGGDVNGFICSLFEDPQTQELAYNFYEKAKKNPDYEFQPKKSTLNYLIRYLIRSKKWSLVTSICQDFKTFHVFPDSFSCCRLVSYCVRARKFKLAHTLLQVFKTDNEIATLAFDSAMKGYNKLHMYSSTIDLYGLMKSCGIVLDLGCYSRVMEAYMKTGDFDRVVSLFEQLETRSSTTIIDSTSSPKPIFREIYGILCESLGKSGRAFEALEFFRDMKKKGIPEDHSIYSSLICSFARIREVKIAEELLMEAESNKMLRDPAVFLKLVLMYVEEGLLEKTKEIVAAMKRVKIRVSDCIFCAIVNGFSKRRGLRAAIEVYEDMILEGCEPGQVTYASIINVYYRLGLYLKAEKAFSEMENKGFDRCIVAYSNMVAMYGKAGRLRDAMRLVAKMKERGCEPNVWIYNSLLDMHGRLLKLRQVEKIWKEMKRRKIVADKVSYTSVISAYSKAREFETCMKYYHEFRINGGVIDRAMAGIMVGVFSKMSRIDELVKLLQDMKTEGTQLDGRLYRSALNALRDAGLQVQAKWLQQSFGTM
ncbi:unnamed protein product [Camellia sinensis]